MSKPVEEMTNPELLEAFYKESEGMGRVIADKLDNGEGSQLGDYDPEESRIRIEILRRLNAGEPPRETPEHLQNPANRLAELCCEPVRTPGEPAKPRCPDGYAYHYPDGIRFNNAQEVNGSKPLEGIRYYFGTPPAERQDGWVDVKERLPEYGEEVIVYCHNKDRRRITALARFTRWEGSPDFYWDNAYPGKGNLHLQIAVTHWRPLPAPPSAPETSKEKP